MSDQNFDQGVDSYNVDCQENLDSFEFQCEQFFDEWGQPVKPHAETAHSEKDEVERIKEDSHENSGSCSQQKTPSGKRCPRVIQTSFGKLLALQKSKKGRQKEMKNIDQFFKTEIHTFLAMLTQLNVLSKDAQSQVKLFKQQSSIVHSFRKVMKNGDLKQKIRLYYNCPFLIKKILTSERLKFGRKIEVLKHLNSCQKFLQFKK